MHRLVKKPGFPNPLNPDAFVHAGKGRKTLQIGQPFEPLMWYHTFTQAAEGLERGTCKGSKGSKQVLQGLKVQEICVSFVFQMFSKRTRDLCIREGQFRYRIPHLSPSCFSNSSNPPGEPRPGRLHHVSPARTENSNPPEPRSKSSEAFMNASWIRRGYKVCRCPKRATTPQCIAWRRI